MANKERPVDANALLNRTIRFSHGLNEDGILYVPLREVYKSIKDAPTLDAVPVVRCKDCIGKAHWYKNDYGCTICGMSGLFVVEDRDFCSYGERKGYEEKAD